MNKKILIVEDDTAMVRMLRDNLVYEGFVVETATDGSEALRQARAFAPDLVLLDLMLPSLDGFAVCRALSASPDRMSIIILTARTGKDDKVKGLELGADDYVTKPFALEELLARVHAVLRRTQPRVGRVALGDLLIDFRLSSARRKHTPVPLTAREFELLHFLADRAGKVVTRDEILRSVWGYHESALTRTVDNFVARLRRKIEPDSRHPRFIKTVHGGGYCLVFEAPTGDTK